MDDGDDVSEAKWDASGVHVEKEEGWLKKKGSMKCKASLSTRTPLLVPSSTTQSAHQTHRVNGRCGVSGEAAASNAPCRGIPKA